MQDLASLKSDLTRQNHKKRIYSICNQAKGGKRYENKIHVLPCRRLEELRENDGTSE